MPEPTFVRDVLLCEAIAKFGAEAQIDMAVEEAAELINGIQKMRRGRATTNDIAEEVADLRIMLDQLELIFRISAAPIEQQKLERLKARLAELPDVRYCRECGCTDEFACEGGCYWVEADLCSECVGGNQANGGGAGEAETAPAVATGN